MTAPTPAEDYAAAQLNTVPPPPVPEPDERAGDMDEAMRQALAGEQP